MVFSFDGFHGTSVDSAKKILSKKNIQEILILINNLMKHYFEDIYNYYLLLI